MARRAIASAAQLRELDGAWEKVATELGDAVAFAVYKAFSLSNEA